MPKESSRATRVAQEIQIQLSKMIAQDVKDPRVGVVTITGVEVTRDFAHAKIYIVTRDEKTTDLSLEILNKAAGFLRRQLGRELMMRVIPELHFQHDHSSTYGRHIDSLLRNMNVDDDESETK